MTIPQGRLRRTAPLAAMSARAAGEGVVDVLRRHLKGERGASLEFHVRNAELMSLWCGQAAPLARSRPAAEIVDEIATALGLRP